MLHMERIAFHVQQTADTMAVICVVTRFATFMKRVALVLVIADHAKRNVLRACMALVWMAYVFAMFRGMGPRVSPRTSKLR